MSRPDLNLLLALDALLDEGSVIGAANRKHSVAASDICPGLTLLIEFHACNVGRLMPSDMSPKTCNRLITLSASTMSAHSLATERRAFALPRDSRIKSSLKEKSTAWY